MSRNQGLPRSFTGTPASGLRTPGNGSPYPDRAALKIIQMCFGYGPITCLEQQSGLQPGQNPYFSLVRVNRTHALPISRSDPARRQGVSRRAVSPLKRKQPGKIRAVSATGLEVGRNRLDRQPMSASIARRIGSGSVGHASMTFPKSESRGRRAEPRRDSRMSNSPSRRHVAPGRSNSAAIQRAGISEAGVKPRTRMTPDALQRAGRINRTGRNPIT